MFDDSRIDISMYRSALFPLGLTGAAIFHQVLSNLALYLQNVQQIQAPREYQKQEELIHQAQTFKRVNGMIASKEATSNEAISAVAGLACHAVCSIPIFGHEPS